MSRTIENRVVEMQFQNKQFEDAVAQSRQSIKLLEKDIKLLEGVEALKSLDARVQSIDFSNMSTALESITDRFSNLGVVGMSVLNNITSTVYGKMISAINSLSSTFTGLFNTIYQRGMTRATNIQKADFALQGLLSTQYDIENEYDIIAQKKKDIGNVIDTAVAGTAYGYDQAASVATTLAASYGTTDEAIVKIGDTLNAIVGVAAQTSTDFTSVAGVFTKVAASGKAMNMELNSVSNWGIGATAMIAEYINKNKELQKQINKSISTSKKHRKETQVITEADVYEAASRGAITADIFMDVFGVFFANAKKANDTLDGITSNIYAALGRLGAAFLTPLIENEGPVVKFLQAVRQKLVDLLNVLNKFQIPKYFTDILIDFIDAARSFLEDFNISSYLEETVKHFSNYFNILSKVFRIYDTWTGKGYGINRILFGENGAAGDNTQYRMFTDMMSRWKEQRNFIDKSLDSFVKDVLRDSGVKGEEHINNVYEQMKLLGDEGIYAGLRVGEVWEEARKRRDQYYEGYREEENQAKEDALKRSKELWDKYTELSEIMDFNYFNKIMEGFGNLYDSISSVIGIFIEAFEMFDASGERTSMLHLLFGDTDEATVYDYRSIINNIAQSFYNLTENIKKFVQSEDARDIITFVAGVFDTAFDIIGAIYKVLKNAIKSFMPLIGKIVSFISTIFGTINGMKETAQEADVFTNIADALSFVIDKLAKGLEFAWDALMAFLGGLTSGNGVEFLTSFYEVIKNIANYIYTQWPVWVEKVTPYL